MTSRESICSQYSHCLSCPLSVRITGKDCRELTQEEINRYGGKEMYINGKWYTEPEIQAHVMDLEAKIKKLEEENKQLREQIAMNSEEEYE